MRWTPASSASWPVTKTRGRIDRRALERRDGAAGHAVVGHVDRVEAVIAERGDRALHLLLGLVRAPVGRVVALHDLGALLLEHLGRAVLVGLGVAVGGRAVDHHDVRVSSAFTRLHLHLGLLLADLERVDRHVVVDVGVRDQAPVGDHLHVRLLGSGHDRGGGLDVDGADHDHLRALGDGRLGLLLLLGRVLVRVRVDDLAVRAQLLHAALEVRPVLLLVAGGLRLREEERDRAAAATAAVAAVSASSSSPHAANVSSASAAVRSKSVRFIRSVLLGPRWGERRTLPHWSRPVGERGSSGFCSHIEQKSSHPCLRRAPPAAAPGSRSPPPPPAGRRSSRRRRPPCTRRGPGGGCAP